MPFGMIQPSRSKTCHVPQHGDGRAYSLQSAQMQAGVRRPMPITTSPSDQKLSASAPPRSTSISLILYGCDELVQGSFDATR